MATTRKKCRSCGEPFRLVRNASTGAWVPLQDAFADAHQQGAMVMIGSVAFSEPVDAIQRVAKLLGMSDADAADEIKSYPWHLNHFAACPDADKYRKNR